MSNQPPRVRALDRLGDELERTFAAAERAERVKRRRRRRLRIGALTALAVALAPAAIATRSIWEPAPLTSDPEEPGGSTPAILLEGIGPSEPWRLTATQGSRGTCLLLGLPSDTGARGQSCTPPDPDPRTVETNIINGRHDGFIYGAVRPEVARVVVEANGVRRAERPRRPPADALRRADLEPDFKVYVAAFDAAIDLDRLVRVTALDARGNVVGRHPPAR